MSFDYALRGKRRGSVTRRKSQKYWCVCVSEGMLKQFNNTFHTYKESNQRIEKSL